MNCDRLAPVYALLERAVFGGALQRARTALLPMLAGPARVLLVGEGDGRFLRRLLLRFPTARIDCVDASEGMLRLARTRVPPGAAVDFIQARLPGWTPPTAEYDLVVTNFFLDCFTGMELGAVVPLLRRALRPDGEWLVTEFALPERPRVWRFAAGGLLSLMYFFFRCTTGLQARTLPDYAKALRQTGLKRHALQESVGGLLRSEIWRALPPVGRDSVEPASTSKIYHRDRRGH